MRDSYPYWPANFKQNPFAIVGRQVAIGLDRLNIDCRIPPSNGMIHDINTIIFPRVTVAKIDAQAVAGFNQISGRGSGPGLMELMSQSIAATKARGEAEK
jgi:hypothetical protein